MKARIIFLFIGIVAGSVALKIFQPSNGPHDGIVKEAGEYYIEMKTTSTNLYAFLLNKQKKPMENRKISCETRFTLADGTDMKIPLKPFGKDGFTAESMNIKYSSCVIIFNVLGNSVSAKFENENLIVKNN